MGLSLRCAVGAVAGIFSLAGTSTGQVQWRLVDFLTRGGLLGVEGVTFDANREVVVLFGGDLQDGTTPYSLLEWNGASLVRTGDRRTAATGAVFPAIAYDTERRKVVVFGGICAGACPGGSGPMLLDATWEYDGAWQLRAPAHAPAARWHAAMAYDRARHCMVLAGGRDAAGQFLPETWEYDGIDWLRRDSVNPARLAMRPTTRCGKRTVLVGGGNTWEWDGQDWTQRFLSAAPPHPWGIVYDEARQRVVVYSASGSENGMWEWDGFGPGWTARLDQQGPLPEWSVGMTYDLTRAQVVWINSLDMGPYVGRGTLVYEPVQAARYLPFGSGCTSAASAPDLRAAPFHLPWLGDTVCPRPHRPAAGQPAGVPGHGLAGDPAGGPLGLRHARLLPVLAAAGRRAGADDRWRGALVDRRTEQHGPDRRVVLQPGPGRRSEGGRRRRGVQRRRRHDRLALSSPGEAQREALAITWCGRAACWGTTT